MEVFPGHIFDVINFISAGSPFPLPPLSSPHGGAQGRQAFLRHCIIDSKSMARVHVSEPFSQAHSPARERFTESEASI